jgi:hypothetical protein
MSGVVSVPVPLMIVPSDYYTTPYVAVLLIFVMAFSALLMIFPSLRRYRKKSNIILYAAAALLIILFAFQIDNVGRRAIISYSYAGSMSYISGQTCELAMEAHNYGDRTADFQIIITSVNASFPLHPSQERVSSTIKIPFLLLERGSPGSAETETVSFTIDQNVTGFSFTMYAAEQCPSLVVASGDTSVSFAWNRTENCYELSLGSGFT